MQKVCCFGELLLRLPPARDGGWLREQQLPVFVGGAELNVATALSVWQVPVKYCTALPDNIIAREIKDYLEAKNIDTSSIIFSGERIGLYYLKEGADMKSEENIFDRKYSSFSALPTGVVDWENLLDNVSWFHFSAIAPAVSASAAEVCKEALEVARNKNCTISLDLNYRSLLWKYGKKPVEVLPELVKNCNVVMGNIWAAHTLLDIPLDEKLISEKRQEDYCRHASYTARMIFERFPECRWVANTFRFDADASQIRYFATLDSREGQVVSPVFTTGRIVDKVGSGDCFMAGLIYGFWEQHAPSEVVDFAAAAAFAKLQEKGDSTRNTTDLIRVLLNEKKMIF